MIPVRNRIALLVWAGLWISESMLGRAVQPTLLMSMLATGTLTLGSVCLLVFARAGTPGDPPNRVLRVLTLIGAAGGLGSAAALLIRGLYIWLNPEVRPFGLIFNIVADTAWISVHALLVGILLRLARCSAETR